MSDGTTIEWLDQPGYKAASWNPTRGCTRVSEGCHHCYAEVMAARFSGPGQWGHGFAEMRGGDHRWTGRVELVEDQLLMPMKWRKPRCIFVNSTSDLFHERLPDEAIDRVFAVMALCPQHRFIVLTKRPERMRNWFSIGLRCVARVFDAAERAGGTVDGVWPLPNVWIGTSVEDQATADERIPHLLATPAAVRFVSYEPALGPVDFRPWLGRLDWIIAGGESGPGARPTHQQWFRSARDQCTAAQVAFFLKQWGEWAPHKPIPGGDLGGDVRAGRVMIVHPTGQTDVEVSIATGGRSTIPGSRYMARVGKHRAGHLLDGREWRQFPTVRTAA